MTCVALERELCASEPQTGSNEPQWELVRALVLWSFVALLIAAPAAMSALVLLRA